MQGIRYHNLYLALFLLMILLIVAIVAIVIMIIVSINVLLAIYLRESKGIVSKGNAALASKKV